MRFSMEVGPFRTFVVRWLNLFLSNWQGIINRDNSVSANVVDGCEYKVSS